VLFHRLGTSDAETLAYTVKHFAVTEVEKKDRIATSYSGRSGIDRIVTSIADHLLEKPFLPVDTEVLDVGAGDKFFTTGIAKGIEARNPKASSYAMDLTPDMLLSFAKKNTGKTCVGTAENSKGTTNMQEFFDIPYKLDAAELRECSCEYLCVCFLNIRRAACRACVGD
jgi:hypothetical protein